jgi:3-hydroxyacyl-CoA dehydrogenase/enoyl-CoA hydratase/3-hydroxybutyryl-CoA epimerase
MCAAVEGAQVDFDSALKIEGRYFTELATGKHAKNMIKAFFFDLQKINGGGSRPSKEPIPKWKSKKVGILGAGMMGAGIAYVSARSGIEVVLIDVPRKPPIVARPTARSCWKSASPRVR